MATARSRGTVRAKPRTDAYIGLLIVSLVALCTASLFAYLDWSSYPQTKPKAVQMAPRGGGAAPTGMPQGVPAGPQVGQPGGQPQPGGVPPPNVPPPPPAKK